MLPQIDQTRNQLRSLCHETPCLVTQAYMHILGLNSCQMLERLKKDHGQSLTHPVQFDEHFWQDVAQKLVRPTGCTIFLCLGASLCTCRQPIVRFFRHGRLAPLLGVDLRRNRCVHARQDRNGTVCKHRLRTAKGELFVFHRQEAHEEQQQYRGKVVVRGARHFARPKCVSAPK